MAGKTIIKRKESITPNSSLFDFTSKNDRLTPEELEIAKYGTEIFRYDISELRYLSENKSELPRVIDIGANLSVRGVGTTGKYTLHQLLKEIIESENEEKISS